MPRKSLPRRRKSKSPPRRRSKPSPPRRRSKPSPPRRRSKPSSPRRRSKPSPPRRRSPPRRKFGRVPVAGFEISSSRNLPPASYPEKTSKSLNSHAEIANILKQRNVLNKEDIRQNILNFLDACEERLLTENESVFQAAEVEVNAMFENAKQKAERIVKVIEAQGKIRDAVDKGTVLDKDVMDAIQEDEALLATIRSSETLQGADIAANLASVKTSKDEFVSKLRTIRSVPWIFHLMMLSYLLYIIVYKGRYLREIFDGPPPPPPPPPLPPPPEPEPQNGIGFGIAAAETAVIGSAVSVVVFECIRIMRYLGPTPARAIGFDGDTAPIDYNALVRAAPRDMVVHEAPLVGGGPYSNVPHVPRWAIEILTQVLKYAVTSGMFNTVMEVFSPPLEPGPEPEQVERMESFLRLLTTEEREERAWENFVLVKVWPILVALHIIEIVHHSRRPE